MVSWLGEGEAVRSKMVFPELAGAKQGSTSKVQPVQNSNSFLDFHEQTPDTLRAKAPISPQFSTVSSLE